MSFPKLLGLATALVVVSSCGDTVTDPDPDPDPVVPELGKIVFASAGDIWAMNDDGSGRISLTSDGATDDTPSWSSDGARIVFSRDGNIHVMNADGSDPVMVSSSAQRDQFPHMSPNGQQIAFSRDVDQIEVPQIFVINVDGTGETNLTNNFPLDCFQPMGPPPTWTAAEDCLFEAWPRWSPDGQQILFNSAPLPADADIWVMNADGTGRRSVSNSPDKERNDFFASWSPNGDEIAFSGAAGWLIDGLAPDDIYVVNIDGTGLRTVTANVGPARNIGPGWSPDGAQLVFHQEGGGGIFKIDSDGANQIELDAGAYPDWAIGPMN